jgi:hypothetical protein
VAKPQAVLEVLTVENRGVVGTHAGHYSLRAALAVWACDDHHVAVGVTKPYFPVAWSWVDVGFLSAQSASLFDDCIKVVHLEPEQDAVPERRCVRIGKVGMIFLVPGMELKKKATITEHPLIQIAMAVLW